MEALTVLLPLLLLVSPNEGTPTNPSPSPDSSINGAWVFQYFETVATGEHDIPPTGMHKVTLTFNDSTCGGRAPCNLYSAKFKLHRANGITLSEMVSTLMACEWSDWEGRYYNALLNAQTYHIKDAELRLYFDNGRQAAVFGRAASAQSDQ